MHGATLRIDVVVLDEPLSTVHEVLGLRHADLFEVGFSKTAPKPEAPRVDGRGDVAVLLAM